VSYLLEEAGLVDYLNFSLGSHYRRSKLIGTTMYRPGYQVEEATGALSRGASVPTMVTGRIMDLSQAEKILREGKADMVSMVRALIADPELVKKTKEGRDSEIRCCISCDQACAGGMTTRGVMGCVVNPAAGNERTRGDQFLTLSARPRRVLIIGGGPSGMEAARASALRGHRVVLHEKSGRLGGQVKLIEKSPSRSYVAAMLGFYEAELHRLGVEVVLRSELRTKADIEAVGADAVVVATGAEPRRDGLQAWRPDLRLPLDGIRFLTGWDVLEGAEVVGPVLLVDEVGHYESIDVAETLVQAGHKVHHVTRFSTLGANIPVSYDYAAGPHQERLYKGDYELYTRVMVTDVAPGRGTIALLAAPDRTTELDVQTFVFMTGSLPDHTLHAELENLDGIVTIGDAAGPRTLEPAIAEGSLAPDQFEETWTRPEWVRYAGGSSI
jgi:heterodisulfide reductase subunit A-like polyferredoxin